MLSKLTYRQIFLMDGMGALLTAILLGIVLPYFEQYIGMPVNTLYLLASLAIIFMAYSFTCFFTTSTHQQVYLKIVATANLLYCLMTLTLIIMFFSKLTLLGLAYFIGEILIIITLSTFELSYIRSQQNP